MSKVKKPDKSIKYGQIAPEIVKDTNALTAIICARLVTNKPNYHPTVGQLSYQTNLSRGAVAEALEWLLKKDYALKDKEDGFYPTGALANKVKKTGFLVENAILYNENLLPIQRVLYGHMIYRPNNHGNNELSLYTGLSESSIRRVKSDLVEAKVLELEQRGNGRSHRNGYKLLLKTHVIEHGWDKPKDKAKQDESPESMPVEKKITKQLRTEFEQMAADNLQGYDGDHNAPIYRAAISLIVEANTNIAQAEDDPMEELDPAKDEETPAKTISLAELIEFVDHNTLNAVETRLKDRGDRIAHPASYYKKCLWNEAKDIARSFEKDFEF